MRRGCRHGRGKLRSLVSAIGKQLTQKWIHSEQGRDHQYPAVPVLNIGGMNNAVQQQPYRIDKDMPLLAFDLLASIIAVRIDAGPPFCRSRPPRLAGGISGAMRDHRRPSDHSGNAECRGRAGRGSRSSPWSGSLAVKTSDSPISRAGQDPFTRQRQRIQMTRKPSGRTLRRPRPGRTPPDRHCRR